MTLSPPVAVALAAVAVGAGGCSGGAVRGVDPSGPCLVAAGPREPVDTVVVALLDSVSIDRLGDPRTHAERIVSRQLYERLVRIDCEGRAIPGLGSRWRSSDSGRVWTVEIDTSLRFADDSAITAEAVRDSWNRQARLPGMTVATTGPTRLRIVLPVANPGFVTTLGSEQLAVVGSAGGGRASESGGYRLTTRIGGATAPSSISLGRRRAPGENGRADAGPHHAGLEEEGIPEVVHVEIVPGGDARDLLDRTGVAPPHLIVTRDRSAIEYARARGDLEVVPLAWDREYALVTAPGVPRPQHPDSLVAADLAAAAVRNDARAAVRSSAGPPGSCRGPASAAPPRRVVAYLASDPIARDLAARIVSLASAAPPAGWLGAGLTASGGAPLRAAPYSGPALDSVISAGGVAAAVVGFFQNPAPACADTPRLPLGAGFVPLVESRAHLILRRDAPPVILEADGTFRFAVR